MKMSRRATRMAKHHRRTKRGSELNLVSLMDIFTILLFFLLINQADVQNLPSASTIKLPESIAESKPRDTVVVLITGSDILVGGVAVMSVTAALASESDGLESVRAALQDLKGREVLTPTATADGAPADEKEVTIMGDRAIPYKLLKKIIVSCTEASYNRVSLAVVQKEDKGGA